MNLEKTIADQVRQLPDKQLAEMALKAGFTVKLSKPNGAPAPKKPRAPKKEKTTDGLNLSTSNISVDAILKKLEGAKTDGIGLSTAELAKETGVDKGAAARILKKLVADGKVFKGGDRRFTRYAMSQKLADDASIAARGG